MIMPGVVLTSARVFTTEQDTATQVVALKTAVDAARLFKVHPATVSRLLTQVRLGNPQKLTSSRSSEKTPDAK